MDAATHSDHKLDGAAHRSDLPADSTRHEIPHLRDWNSGLRDHHDGPPDNPGRIRRAARYRRAHGGDRHFFLGGLFIAYHAWTVGRDHEQRVKQYAAIGVRAALSSAGAGTAAPRTFVDLSTAVEQRLRESGFTVARDITLPNGDTVGLAASRTEFTFPGVVRVPVVEHLFLWQPQIAAVPDFDALFEGGFQYATHTYRNSLRGRDRVGHVILPCIVVNGASPELIAFASGRPPRRWMRFEFPVLHDLSTGRTFYYDKTVRLGAMLLPGARALANLAFGIDRPAAATST